MKLIIGFSVVVDYLLCGSLLSVELLTVTFLTATVTDKRRLHFLAFYVCQVIFTVNHLGEIFAAFHGIFQFIKTLQTWCWLKKDMIKSCKMLLYADDNGFNWFYSRVLVKGMFVPNLRTAKISRCHPPLVSSRKTSEESRKIPPY